MHKEIGGMGSAGKMQGFLQRMLRRSDEELNENTETALSLQTTELSKSSLMKASWMKKFGSCTPSRSFQIQSSAVRPSTLKNLESCRRRSAPSGDSTPKTKAAAASVPLEMPDLESIIREFEMGYLSPTKHEPVECVKQGNFVKKIVAAFEVKYKAYNDLKDGQDANDSETAGVGAFGREDEEDEMTKELESVQICEVSHSSPKIAKRRSGFFSSPFKESRSAEKCEAGNEKEKRRSGLFSSPNSSKEQRSSRRSGFFSSPFKITHDTPKATKSGSSSVFRASDEESREPDVTAEIRAPAKDTRTISEASVSGVNFEAFAPVDISEHSQSTPARNFESSSPLKSMDDSKSTDSGMESPLRILRDDSTDSNTNSSSSIPCISPSSDSKRSDSRDSSSFKFADEDSGCADRESSFSSPFRTAHDDTRSVRSVDLSTSLPDLDDATLRWEAEVAPNHQINVTANSSSLAAADKTPKIVGAYLKKPIEVEDTSIDWIPITGKKLPRKRSLKKLLSMLTRKKSLDRKSKVLFCSERNLSEESREFQDSGYDEKSCSSSSLTSLVSITEILLRQEDRYAGPDKRSNTVLRTFRSKDNLKEEEEEGEEVEGESCGEGLKVDSKKKLFLTEVRREDLKLDLGPCYPSTGILSMSLDRRALPKRSPLKPSNVIIRLPKHPFLPKIPKHPFVSMTKDEFTTDCRVAFEEHQTFVRADPVDVSAEMYVEPNEFPGVTIRNDLYEVEFRRGSDEIRGTASCRSSTSTESIYDIPRPFISRSESEIPKMFRSSTMKNCAAVPIYDIPKARAFGRPKSSVYDDALSLKRRTASMAVTSVPDFYSVAIDEEPHYATVNPRNKRICLSEEMLRSCRDLSSCEKKSCLF